MLKMVASPLTDGVPAS